MNPTRITSAAARPRRLLTDRRQVLGGLGALGTLAAAGWPAPARAAGAVEVLLGASPGDDRLMAAFTEATGIEVRKHAFVSSADTVGKIRAPGGTAAYDVCYAFNDFVQTLADSDLLAPLPESAVPNQRHVAPVYSEQAITRNGQTVGIPFVWGYDTCIFNRAHIPEDDALTQSWGLMFDDRYAGRVALRDDAFNSITIAALHLGIEDPFAMDRSDIREVQRFLISKKPNFRTLWSNFGEGVSLMASGEVWAIFGWIAQREALRGEGHDVASNWPSDGVLVWALTAFVPRDAPNMDNAHRFVDFLLGETYGEMMTRLRGLMSTSELAAARFTAEERAALGYDVTERADLRLVFNRLPAEVGLWNEAWSAFKAA